MARKNGDYWVGLKLSLCKEVENNIEQYEKEILEDFEKGNFVSVENAKEEKHFAEAAARNFMKRNSNLSR